MKRPKGKELCKLSKEELEKEKLIKEVKSIGTLWRIPAFWAFLAFFGTAIVGYTTGYFQSEKAKMELTKERISLENERLDNRKHRLLFQMDSLKEEFQTKQTEFDSLYMYTNRLLSSQDSIKAVYKIWQRKKQSKAELIDEATDLILEIRSALELYEKKTSSLYRRSNAGLSRKQEDSLWNYDINMSSFYSNELMSLYRQRYMTKALVVRDKLLAYNIKGKRKLLDDLDYNRPTNPIGMNMVVDELEYLTQRLNSE